MRTLELTIKGLPPCPRNRSHVAMVRKMGAKTVAHVIKTEAARAYEDAIKRHLEPFDDQIDQFACAFDKNRHGLQVSWAFGTPDYFTKEEKISENSVDLDAHKVLQDTVMGCVGVDDAYIIEETRIKYHSPEHVVRIRLSIVGNVRVSVE